MEGQRLYVGGKEVANGQQAAYTPTAADIGKQLMQDKEKHSQAAVLGLQHLLAMYSGSILVPIMIAGALGYSAIRAANLPT